MLFKGTLVAFLLLTPLVFVQGTTSDIHIQGSLCATSRCRSLNLHPLSVLADGTDWVSPEYLIDQRTNPIQDTASAKKSLVGIAGTYGRKGPWSKCLIRASCVSVGRFLIATVRRAHPS
jgi:hypothetical protein